MRIIKGDALIMAAIGTRYMKIPLKIQLGGFYGSDLILLVLFIIAMALSRGAEYHWFGMCQVVVCYFFITLLHGKCKVRD